ncbi:peptidyl-prolyl cis-trans isomerase [bacterium]|nr:peptidyl-prolyl cis-trans isomerase [bacterium]
MMQKLRSRYVMKKILWAILILTIPSFVLFYGFSGSGRSGNQPQLGNTFVEIQTNHGKQEITREDMKSARDSLSYYYSMFLGQNATNAQRTQISSALTNKEIADYAVSAAAMQQLGEEWGIAVSMEQVSRYLSNMGLTDQTLPLYLQQRRISKKQLIAQSLFDLQNSRTQQLVGSVARVSLLELWQEYLLQNEELKAEYAVLKTSDLLDSIEVTDAEVAEYYNDHLDNYIEPEKRIYRYIKREPAPLDFMMDIPESESKVIYDTMDPERQPQYATGERRQVRNIMLTVDEGENADDVKGELEQIRERIANGESFEELANEFSDDPANIRFDEGTTATMRGGLLATRVRTNQPETWAAIYGQAWVDAVTTTPAGELTDVVEGPDQESFLLAEVEDVAESTKIPFEEARPRIERQLRQSKIREQQEARSKEADEIELEMRELVATRTTLEGVARELNMDVQETSPTISTSTSIRGVGSFRQNEMALSRLDLGEMSPALRSDMDAVVVMEIAKILPERQQTLDEVRDQVTRALKREVAAEQATEIAEQIRERVESGQDMEKVAEQLGAEYVAAGDAFTRANAPGELRGASEFANESLRAKVGEPRVVKSGSGDFVNAAVVFELTEKNPPDKKVFLQDMRQLESGLRSMKERTFVDEFRKDALKTMKPKFNEEMFTNEQM